MLNFDGTVKVISDTYTLWGLTVGNLITVIVAFISFAGVLYSTRRTIKTTKKINDDNKIFQEKMSQKNIDANLKAKARIEWIQKVRQTTAELIAVYSNLLNENDNKKLLDLFVESREKSELLILFFGHESKTYDMTKITRSSLLNQENNENKNDNIVSFLSDLSNEFFNYYTKAMCDTYTTLNEIRTKRLQEMYKNVTEFENVTIDYDEEGNEHFNGIPIVNPNDNQRYNQADNDLQEFINFTLLLQKKLIFLRNVMRTYLKIEWNKAKNGE